MEDQVWFHLNRLAYPELHAKALGKFDTYLQTNLVKLFSWTITRTLERVSEMLEMRHFVPAPGDDVATAMYDAPRAVVPVSTRRQLEFDLLPEEWQTRVKGKMINWLNKSKAEKEE